MRRFLISGVLISLAVTGCTKESAPAGPGAQKPTTTTTERSYQQPDKDRTFTLKVPSGTTSITQGERKDVTISIDRGSQFKQSVMLKFHPPLGVQVEPSEVQLKADQEQAKVMIDAGADAALGETKIDVTATPETGKATSMTILVKVDQKK